MTLLSDCGIARMMTKRVVEVNRAFSANQTFFIGTLGRCPRLRLNAAPFALKHIGLSQSVREIEKKFAPIRKAVFSSRPLRNSNSIVTTENGPHICDIEKNPIYPCDLSRRSPRRRRIRGLPHPQSQRFNVAKPFALISVIRGFLSLRHLAGA